MGRLIVLFSVLSFTGLSAQLVQNGSFEAPQSAAETVPPGWFACQGSADVQPIAASEPGIYGMSNEAAQGKTYLGLISTQNQAYREAIGQPTQLAAGTDYSGAVSLCLSDAHPNWNGRSRLHLYGGQDCDDRAELLWDSGPIDAFDAWEPFSISFSPSADHQFLILEAVFEDGSGTMSYLLIDDLYLNNVLPISLAAFTGTIEDQKSQLRWETEASILGQSFTILHSSTGIANDFVAVGKVNGSTNQSSYAFEHGAPFSGSNFYQLEMQDENGKISHSEVLRLEHGAVQQFRFWPNPSQGMVHIRSGNPEAGISVEILDLTGRLVYQMESPSADFELQLPAELKAGLYTLRLQQGQLRHAERLILR